MPKILYPETQRIFVGLIHEDVVIRYMRLLREHHRDTYTHSLRVGLLCIDLGFENGLHDSIKELGYSGLLHDVEKIDVPIEILTKRGELDEHESAIMQLYDALMTKRDYRGPLKLSEVETTLRAQFTGDPKYIDQVLRRKG